MQRLEQAVRVVRERTSLEPRVTLILAAGAERLADEIQVESALAYGELDDRLQTTDEREGGRLLLGRWEGVPVAAMQGAVLRRPGLGPAETALPVRVLRLLSPREAPPPLLIAGACVSLHPEWSAGVVVVEDHLNLTGENPLVGPNLDGLGPRFPDLSGAYDPALRQAALGAAEARRIPVRRGVYVAVGGPQAPTPAERRMHRWMGADVVGWGMVPEVIVARHMGMPTLAVLAALELSAAEGGAPRAHTEALEGAGRILRDVTTSLTDLG